MPEPIKPLKADNKSPVLKIEVDPSSFKEFAIYQNLKFQVDESKTPFNKKDSEEEWNNLELLKGSTPGSYLAKFSNAGRSVSYAVKPVFTGIDYDNAVKVFEKEYAVYSKQAQARIANDKAAREKYTRDSIQNNQVVAENTRIEQLNAIIAQKNREIEKQNELAIKRVQEIEKQNAITEKKNLETRKKKEEYAKRMLEVQKENEKRRLEAEKQYAELVKEQQKWRANLATFDDVYRSFKIDNFGYWNCDIATRQEGVTIVATFKDEKGNLLDLYPISIINRSMNSVLQVNSNELFIVPGSDNMILAVYRSKFVYVSYEAFRKLNITAGTKEVTIVVKIVEEANVDYEYVRRLLKN